MEENIENSISSIFNTIKEFLPEESDTLNSFDITPEQKNTIDQNVQQEVNDISIEPLENIVEDIINEQQIIQEQQNNIDQKISQNDSINKELDNNSINEPENKSFIKPQNTVNNSFEEAIKKQNIETESQPKLRQIAPTLYTIKEPEQKQETNKIEQDTLANISPQSQIPFKKFIDDTDSIEDNLIISPSKETEQPTNEIKQTNTPVTNTKQIQTSINVTPKNENIFKNIVEPKLETNNIVNNIQPQQTQLLRTSTPSNIKDTKNLKDEIGIKLTPSIASDNLSFYKDTLSTDLDEQVYSFTKNTNIAKELENDITSLDQTFKKQNNAVNEPVEDILKDLQPQQEQINYETSSELPTGDMFAQVEESNDTTSAEILANTEKTNTTLEALTQLLAAFMQTTGLQNQNARPIPVPTPTSSQSKSQPGIPDAILASQEGLIPTIRNKFTYSV